MKSPDDFAAQLSRQWRNTRVRVDRLLNETAWPMSISIAAPTPSEINGDIASVRTRLRAWRAVATGEVVWGERRYRSLAEPLVVPSEWILRTPWEWIEATSDWDVIQEFKCLMNVLANVEADFHQVLVKHLNLVTRTSEQEVVAATSFASNVTPGIGDGKALRAISLNGIDSKFLERNRTLVSLLIDERFGGAVSRDGLEAFLGVSDYGGRWLLAVDLDGHLLPYRKTRLLDMDLGTSAPAAANRVIVVENEQCHVQLPEKLPGTLVILGAGLNLQWLRAEWLDDVAMAYWGDIDTWGLAMLANARQLRPDITPLLMSGEIFDGLAHEAAVVEPVVFDVNVPAYLTASEAALYHRLLDAGLGRLEQERVPRELVVREIAAWSRERRR